MIVKNIITLDTKKGLIPELSFVEGISDNIISIKVFNIGTNPKIEIYYGCDFKELTGMDGNEFIIPSEYCSDNEIIHLRYIDDKSKSNFIHIVGDESAYENLKLTKKSNFLFCCDGKRKKSSNSTSDITIDDYLDILSKNPVTNEAISSAIVEIQNVINEEKENLANLSSDVESLQAEVQENKTGTGKAISGLNASMSTMGQHLSTLGNDFDTFKSSTTEGMSNLSNRVGVVESKVGEFGTAAKKNYTTTVASGNTNLPTSGAVYTALDGKVDKVDGKGLSTNDYTTTEKENLANLSSDVESLQAEVQENKTGTGKAISGLNASMSTMGQHLSTLGNDFDTFKSSTTEGMSNLSNRVGVVESKVGEFGTAAKKNYTTTVASGNTNLPTSGAVYTALDGKAEYEEGTFTPKFWNASNVEQTFRNVVGYYKKIGNLCYIYIYAITFSDISVRKIDNLPFNPDSGIHGANIPTHQKGTVFANGVGCCVNVPEIHGQIQLEPVVTGILLVEGIYNI